MTEAATESAPLLGEPLPVELMCEYGRLLSPSHGRSQRRPHRCRRDHEGSRVGPSAWPPPCSAASAPTAPHTALAASPDNEPRPPLSPAQPPSNGHGLDGIHQSE